MFNNEWEKLKFTERLAELIVENGLSLSESLKILRNEKIGNRQTVLAKTADFIIKAMSSGWDLSYALNSCDLIRFDKTYISFVGFAEKTGKMDLCLEYLKKKLNRKKENENQVLNALAYPAFVVFLTLVMVVVLAGYGRELIRDVGFESEFRESLFSCLIFGTLVLVMVGFVVGWIVRSIFKTNQMMEAFIAVDFLTVGGMKLSDAVEVAAGIFGPETKEGLFFENLREKLSFGIRFDDALNDKGFRWGDRTVLRKLQNEFYYVAQAGGRNIAFGKIAAWLESRDQKRKKLFFRVIEPLSILGTGAFVLVFLMTLIMPLLNGTYFGV